MKDTVEGWTVPLTLNGVAVPFLVDTGAERSVVFEAAADRLGLARDEWAATSMQGIGGTVRRPNALPRSVTLGGVPLRRRTLAADASLSVAPSARIGLAGLLGTDLLASFDVEIDMRGGTMSLLAASGCHGRYAPWTGPYDVVQTKHVTPTVILVPVLVDGAPLDALLDTGAALTVLTLAGAARLPVPAAGAEVGSPRTAAGLGPGSVTLHGRAARVGLLGGAARAMTVWTGPVSTLRAIGLLLGRDWIAGRRLWLSPANDTLFVDAPR